ncbi:unnamed protein product, partial [Polarella glacialis]
MDDTELERMWKVKVEPVDEVDLQRRREQDAEEAGRNAEEKAEGAEAGLGKCTERHGHGHEHKASAPKAKAKMTAWKEKAAREVKQEQMEGAKKMPKGRKIAGKAKLKLKLKLKKASEAKAKCKAKAQAKATKVKAKATKAKFKMRLKKLPKQKSVKAEPGTVASRVAVKSEPGTGPATKVKKEHNFSPRAHFVHQVGFIESVMPEWELCFGSLGTGIVGVCPPQAAETNIATEGGSSSSSSSGVPVKRELEAADAESAPAGSSNSSSSSGSCSAVKTELQEGGTSEAPSRPVRRSLDLSPEAVIILFKNAPASSLQSRNGHSMGGYAGGLDVEERKLQWSSQRSDKQSTKLLTIVDHIGRGGTVLVAVRPPGSSTTYTLLGQVSRIDGLRMSECLVQ